MTYETTCIVRFQAIQDEVKTNETDIEIPWYHTILETLFGICFFRLLYIIQCEAPKIAKLVYNSNNYGLWYL